jgi:hypothetical protein
MKCFILLSTLVLSFTSQASYYATHCSNAQGTLKWESGHNSNTLSLKYYDSEERVKSIPLKKIEIENSEEITISESATTRCLSSKSRTYVAKVQIKAAQDFPDTLDFLGADKTLKDTVICEFHMNSRAACKE